MAAARRSGEGLPAKQEDLSINGHAFEARLYAEDVPKGFLPATGTLTHLRFPDGGARADSGVRAGGDTISPPFYDPMIAKLTVHAATRAAALQRLTAALEHCEVAGSVTNLGFLGALARHDGFSAGDVDTGLIERDLDALIAEDGPVLSDIGAAALCALDLLKPKGGSGFTLWGGGLNHFVTLTHGEDQFDVVVTTHGGADHHVISVGDEQIDAVALDGQWKLGGDRGGPRVARAGNVVTVFTGSGLEFHVADPLDRDAGVGAGAGVIEAPMPGLVKAVFAEAGQEVKQGGDRLAILEAMKMEHSLEAARDGVVAEVLCSDGDQVEAGAPLIRLEDEEE